MSPVSKKSEYVPPVEPPTEYIFRCEHCGWETTGHYGEEPSIPSVDCPECDHHECVYDTGEVA